MTAALKAAGASDTVASLAGQAVSTATAAGIGAVASGGSAAGTMTGVNGDVNNRQLHPTEQQKAKALYALARKQGLPYTLADIEDALRWADYSGETAASNTYVNAAKDAVVTGPAAGVYASTAFDPMRPGIDTHAAAGYQPAGMENGQLTLVQDMNGVAKPNAGLVGFISSNSSGYSWNPSNITSAVDPHAGQAWTSNGYVPITNGNAGPLEHQSVGANGAIYNVPVGNCPAATCTNDGSIAFGSTDAKDQQVLAEYNDAVGKEMGKKLVTVGLTAGAILAAPVTVPGIVATGGVVSGGQSAADQAIDTGTVSVKQTAIDTGKGAVVAVVTLGAVKGAGAADAALEAVLPTASGGATTAEINAGKVANNFYRDGAMADPSRVMSVAGPWKSVAELTSQEADTLVASRLPTGATVTATHSASELNATVPARYDPPYVPGTQVVDMTTTQPAQFVRVFGGSSGQEGTWVMRAEDVAGLTPEQIASKFSLPQVPTMIADVHIPAGIELRVSTANGISPSAKNGILTGDNGRGGGVQFEIQLPKLKLDSTWFTNARPLQ